MEQKFFNPAPACFTYFSLLLTADKETLMLKYC